MCASALSGDSLSVCRSLLAVVGSYRRRRWGWLWSTPRTDRCPQESNCRASLKRHTVETLDTLVKTPGSPHNIPRSRHCPRGNSRQQGLDVRTWDGLCTLRTLAAAVAAAMAMAAATAATRRSTLPTGAQHTPPDKFCAVRDIYVHKHLAGHFCPICSMGYGSQCPNDASDGTEYVILLGCAKFVVICLSWTRVRDLVQCLTRPVAKQKSERGPNERCQNTLRTSNRRFAKLA